MKRAVARYSDDARLVLTERLSTRQFVVNSVSRPGADGRTDHVVTDVWAETRSCDRSPDRTDLLHHHEPLARVLSAYMMRVLDALGVMQGPVTARVAHDEGRGPLLVSALAVPGISPADEALRRANGYDRVADVLDPSMPPASLRFAPVPAGHRIVRVHLRRSSGDAADPSLGRLLRRLGRCQPAPPGARTGHRGGRVRGGRSQQRRAGRRRGGLLHPPGPGARKRACRSARLSLGGTPLVRGVRGGTDRAAGRRAGTCHPPLLVSRRDLGAARTRSCLRGSGCGDPVLREKPRGCGNEDGDPVSEDGPPADRAQTDHSGQETCDDRGHSKAEVGDQVDGCEESRPLMGPYEWGDGAGRLRCREARGPGRAAGSPAR